MSQNITLRVLVLILVLMEFKAALSEGEKVEFVEVS